jgi:signal recognition particle receptor subunit beta
MISLILIITQGGILCYSKNFTEDLAVDNDLVSGFLTAMDSFAKEIKAGGIKSLNFRNFNFLYSYSEKYDTIFILAINKDDPENEAREELETIKEEFLKRYADNLTNWTCEVSIFEEFDEFVEENIFIPFRIILTGEIGVGKTTIMDLFPGETVLKIDDDLNEIVEKTLDVHNLPQVKKIKIREIDLTDLVQNSKIYRDWLDYADAIIVVSNSRATNLGRTFKDFNILKEKVNGVNFYHIANFQDQEEATFRPEKIEETFGVKTYGFSTVSDHAKEKLYKIMQLILNNTLAQKRASLNGESQITGN